MSLCYMHAKTNFSILLRLDFIEGKIYKENLGTPRLFKFIMLKLGNNFLVYQNKQKPNIKFTKFIQIFHYKFHTERFFISQFA